MELKEAQKLAGDVHKEISKDRWDAFMKSTDLMEEAGEVAKAVKAIEGLKEKRGSKEELGEELSDLLYAMFLIADHYNIDIEDFYEGKIISYRGRFKK